MKPGWKEYWRGKTAVITGASSGIGAAVARKLAREGMRVALVARREEHLDCLVDEICRSGGQGASLTADLSQEADRIRVFEWVTEKLGGAHVLVNNAGLGWYGYGSEMPWSVAREMLQVNVGAAVQLTLLFLPGLLNLERAHVLNVGSITGLFPNQGTAVYSGSKAFLDAFTTALYREMRSSRVSVSVIRPGPVSTGFFERSESLPGGYRIPGEHFAIRAEAVARCAWGLLLRPRRVAYVPAILSLTPWIELSFGWIIDRLGPLLLPGRRG